MPDHSQRTFGAAGSATPYDESLASLDRHVEHIPIGWQRLYGDLRSALRAMATPARTNIRIHGGWEEDGLLRVESETLDSTIQGVLRKARVRAMHTCSACGKPGRQRETSDWSASTLCAACAAPRRLAEETRRLLALDRCGTVDLKHEIGTSARATLVRTAARASGLLGASSDSCRLWLRDLLTVAEEASL